ncbi:hypothetical protein HG536_0F03710 [Torulaspora globosa]|uniref:Uncharacterized protein n=1 Tax=Torulaspora globosa TaxID=48254 RepID=A0A7G3ZKL0_9SACH|nr:uncharacterized protein HG536_0F03710 [Torulaspora globosa]QLL34046.1 hypothetical protein HG536_0F03710 [Torulaspora globosa]
MQRNLPIYSLKTYYLYLALNGDSIVCRRCETLSSLATKRLSYCAPPNDLFPSSHRLEPGPPAGKPPDRSPSGTSSARGSALLQRAGATDPSDAKKISKKWSFSCLKKTHSSEDCLFLTHAPKPSFYGAFCGSAVIHDISSKLPARIHLDSHRYSSKSPTLTAI